MRALVVGSVMFGCAVGFAFADVPHSASAGRPARVGPAKRPAEITVARNAATGGLARSVRRPLNADIRSRLAGPVFDNMTQVLPNAAAPLNVSFTSCNSYTDPNGNTTAYLVGLADRNTSATHPCDLSAPAPAYPSVFGCTPWLTDAVWDEYFADPALWPGMDLNDPAPLYRYDFVPIGENESGGATQYDALNVLWFDLGGGFAGGYQFVFDFSGTFSGYFAATFNGWCADNGQGGFLFDAPGQGWVMYDWVDWDVDANGEPVGASDADLYCFAGMMLAGGAFGATGCPTPGDLISVGSTGSTESDPNGTGNLWLWYMTNNGVPNQICGVDPAFDGDPVTISYSDIFNHSTVSYPFVNWFFTISGGAPVCSDFPKRIFVTNVCPASNSDCRYETGSASGEGVYNCVVDAQDLAFLLARFGTVHDPADFDCSGIVDAQDLAFLLSEFGNDCN